MLTKDEILNQLKELDEREFPDYKLGDQVRYCKTNTNIFDIVNSEYPDLFSSNKEFKYYLLNRRGQNPNYPKEMFCPTCGKRIPYDKGYKAHCSNRCSTLDPNVKAKKNKTCLENNGWTTPFERDDVRVKIKDIMNERYGGNPMFSQEVKDKLSRTNYERYGIYNPKLANINHLEDYNEEFIRDNFVKDNKFLLDEIVEYFNISYSHAENIKIRYNLHMSNKNAFHKSELEVIDYIKSLLPNEEVYNNCRTIIKKEDGTRYELDIYIPSRKLAIEYDGLYWHGIHDINEDNEINSSKHLKKTESCEREGIRLLHIFENEWMNPVKNRVWKSMIKNILGLTKRRIYARNCEIREVSVSDTVKFLEENHLQPSSKSEIKLGLYYLGELVSVMTFGRPRYNKQIDYELIRYCNKIDTSVIGAASKLFNYFIKTYSPQSVISYADRKWSTGNLYYTLGFRLDHISPPSYFYVESNGTVHHRGEFKKMYLKDKLEIFDESLTESQNMFNNKYYKIYDCGTYAFVWTSH